MRALRLNKESYAMATQPPEPTQPAQPVPPPVEMPPRVPDVDVPQPAVDPSPTGPANPN